MWTWYVKQLINAYTWSLTKRAATLLWPNSWVTTARSSVKRSSKLNRTWEGSFLVKILKTTRSFQTSPISKSKRKLSTCGKSRLTKIHSMKTTIQRRTLTPTTMKITTQRLRGKKWLFLLIRSKESSVMSRSDNTLWRWNGEVLSAFSWDKKLRSLRKRKENTQKFTRLLKSRLGSKSLASRSCVLMSKLDLTWCQNRLLSRYQPLMTNRMNQTNPTKVLAGTMLWSTIKKVTSAWSTSRGNLWSQVNKSFTAMVTGQTLFSSATTASVFLIIAMIPYQSDYEWGLNWTI